MECRTTRRHRCYLKRASRPDSAHPVARRSRSSAAATAALRSGRRRREPGSSKAFVSSARANPKLYAFASICKNYAANVQCARSFARDSTALSPAQARWHVACEDHESSGPASSEAFPFSRPRWAERWPRCLNKSVHGPLSYDCGVASRIWRCHAQRGGANPAIFFLRSAIGPTPVPIRFA